MVVLNEGLEVLGKDEYLNDNKMWNGVFQNSVLEEIKLPSTLKKIEYSAFACCKNLATI